MRKELPLALLVLLLFLAGCATPPPLHVVPVATISNNAILSYAYGEGSPFRLQSAPVEVTAVVPRVPVEVATKVESPPAAPSSIAQTVAPERHVVSTARTLQKDTTGVSTMRQQFGEASEETLVQRSSIHTKAYAGSEVVKSHHSDIRHQLARASATWYARRPTIRKWSTLSRVVVGDKFEYVVEVCNSTPIDLVFAEVSDQLDPRLSVTPSAIRTTPYAKVRVQLNDGVLSVRFPHGIPRGQTVRIMIPTAVKLEVTEQDAGGDSGQTPAPDPQR